MLKLMGQRMMRFALVAMAAIALTGTPAVMPITANAPTFHAIGDVSGEAEPILPGLEDCVPSQSDACPT